jgi:hypothetical protein
MFGYVRLLSLSRKIGVFMGDVTGRHANICWESDQWGYNSVRQVCQSGTRPQGSPAGAICYSNGSVSSTFRSDLILNLPLA